MNFLILLLPILTQAKFDVKIHASTKPSEAKVEVTGSEEHVISDTEQKTFKLENDQLYIGVTKVLGLKPNHVFIKSPTPWGDLFKIYKWDQTMIKVTPDKAKIGGVTTETSTLNVQEFSNNLTNEVTFTAGMSQTIEDTISNSWSKGGELSIGTEFTVSVDFAVGSAAVTTSLSATASWGEEFTKSRTLTVGSTTGVELTLKQGQTSTVTLSAQKGILEVLVDFIARPFGGMACNYNVKHKNHHYWHIGIGGMISALNSPSQIVTQETFRISFYSNAKVHVV